MRPCHKTDPGDISLPFHFLTCVVLVCVMKGAHDRHGRWMSAGCAFGLASAVV